MSVELHVGEKIFLFHSDGWWDEGRIIKIEGETVFVDFLDWIQCWKISDLSSEYNMESMRYCWVPKNAGQKIVDFGQIVA